MRLILLLSLLSPIFAFNDTSTIHVQSTPACAIYCGAYNCYFNTDCCFCWDWSRANFYYTDDKERTEFHQCLVDQCEYDEFEQYKSYLSGQASTGARSCDECMANLDFNPWYNYEVNRAIRNDERRRLKLTVGLATALPLIAVLGIILLVYQLWYRPRMKRKGRSQAVDKGVDLSTGANSIPLR